MRSRCFYQCRPVGRGQGVGNTQRYTYNARREILKPAQHVVEKLRNIIIKCYYLVTFLLVSYHAIPGFPPLLMFWKYGTIFQFCYIPGFSLSIYMVCIRFYSVSNIMECVISFNMTFTANMYTTTTQDFYITGISS